MHAHSHRYARTSHVQVVGIALDVCSALSYLHRNGVVHGDVKAANVMLTSAVTALDEGVSAPPPLDGDDGRIFCAKLADFGQSLVLQQQQQHGSELSGSPCRRSVSRSGNEQGSDLPPHSADNEPSHNLLRCGQSSHFPSGGGEGRSEPPPSPPSPSNRHCGEGMTTTHTAPEVLQGGPLSLSSDVYALGVLLWELSTGLRPYKQ